MEACDKQVTDTSRLGGWTKVVGGLYLYKIITHDSLYISRLVEAARFHHAMTSASSVPHIWQSCPCGRDWGAVLGERRGWKKKKKKKSELGFTLKSVR